MRIGQIKKVGVREIETPDWRNREPEKEPVKREAAEPVRKEREPVPA